MDPKPAQLVVICPVHNEEQNIAYFFERLKKTLESLDPVEYRYQVLFTNNRSVDRSLAMLEDLQMSHDWVGHLTLSRNHGYQLSVLAGLSTIRADLYMVCDVDCEDPPEILLEFLDAIRNGNDLVYGIRNNREEPWLLSRFRSLFYHSLRTVGDYRIVPYMAEFALFKRCIRDVIIDSDNSAPFLRSEFGYAGFNIIGIPYRREARRYGRTHYNFIGNVRFAVAGLLSSTTFPLRAVFYAFPAISLANLLLLFSFGWGALSAGMTLVGLACLNGIYVSGALAFMSIYLARTYQNGLRRRRFIIDWYSHLLAPHQGIGCSRVVSALTTLEDPGAQMQEGHAEARCISCPLCQSQKAEEVLRSQNSYPILRCRQCSLVFTDDRTAPSANTLYPVGDQTGRQFARKIGWMLKLFLRQREAFVRRLKRSGRLLDFGCGNGAFALQMSHVGFDTVGIEPFSLGATVTAPRLKLIQAPWQEVEGELGSFDVITLWHVLEHLHRPTEMLERLTAHLAPDGVIVISVPNFASFQSTVFRGRWFHLDPPRHLSHFEQATLERCLRQAGLIPEARAQLMPEYGSSGWVQSSLNAVLPHTNYLYELVKDRGALQEMTTLNSVLHFVGSMALAPPLLAMSLPLEALASAANGGAALTIAARRASDSR